MSHSAHHDGHRAAAEYLRQLLLKPGSYRDSWQEHVAKPRDGVINQLAVTELIVNRLRSIAGRPGDAQMMPYQFQETVSGALSGQRLSKDTLQLFIDAFGFAEHESMRLWRLWNGSARITVMSGTHAVPAEAEQDVDRVFGPRRHQTVSLHDHVYVGSDRRIDRVRPLQVIEAIVPGVDRIPFLCDTNVLTLEVGQGGKELSGDVRKISNDVFLNEILLARTLEVGETITLEYWITYRFPGNPQDRAEREFRRAVMRQIQNFDMRVQFHPDSLPARTFWARWDGVEGDVIEREEVTLDKQNSVHRYLRELDKVVVGFYWEWE